MDTPQREKKGQSTSYNFIVRATLSFDGFKLHSRHDDGKWEYKNIVISDLIADQRKYVSDILTLVFGKLEEKEAAHKEKFKTEKLASIFSPSLNYFLGKVFESISIREQATLGEASLQQIKHMLLAFRKAIEKRDIELETYPSIKYVYELVEYSLDKLEKFFQNVKSGGMPNINEKDAEIFASFVENQVAELRQIAQDLDKDYSH